jgi:sterol 3beta-glucosyltransferase
LILFSSFGQALHAFGHRVRLATHEKFRKYVRENGLEFYPLATNPEDLMSFVVKNGGVVPSMSSIMAGEVKKKRHDISEILVSTWRACTQNDDETSAPFTAEVITANPPSFGHIHCAQKLQIPLHIMFTMPWSATSVFPHPFCKIDYSKASREKLNRLSYGVMETLVSFSRKIKTNKRENIE